VTHPFRFGVQLTNLPPHDWRERLSRIEALGYSSVFWPDHFHTQWEPVTALAAAAAATERLVIGSLVYDVDYRHPVVLAKAAATLQLLSGGRHEFGIGAGWMETDYREAGMPYDRAGVRIARLAEALEILRRMWTNDRTSFAGEHYAIENIAKAVDPLPDTPPKVLIGGGGRKVLGLAARNADIIGINPSIPKGAVHADTPGDLSPSRVDEKVRWVREAAAEAGRPIESIELTTLSFVVAITDDPKPLREALARNSPMSVEEIADCPLFITGSAAEIRDTLERRRERTGISYVVIQGKDPALLETFAEAVVAPLAGR
jgi:probable F420-dependent oxidoreductase